MRIVVLGYIVRGPLGGMAWHHLQFLLGLKKLGHEVLFLEDSDYYETCYNPETYITSKDPSFGLNFISTLCNKCGVGENWAYFDFHTNTWFGKKKNDVLSFCKSADIALNVSGINPMREWWSDIPCRVFIDTDPCFTQIRHLSEPAAMELAKGHTHHFSYGENIGKKDCGIPDDGFIWKPTRQPVVMELWKVAEAKPSANWTTVMQWDSYSERIYQGRKFGMKSASFDSYIDLPRKMPKEKFELAIGSSTAPRDELNKHGWIITNPYEATKTPERFQEYLAESKGEWTIAKQGYVDSNSGWFSDRTLNYMVSGKPVVIQDTSFPEEFRYGKGLMPYNDIEQAMQAIDSVNKDYAAHCKASRKIVEDHFESGLVLSQLVRQL
jgi:hypothetical protein